MVRRCGARKRHFLTALSTVVVAVKVCLEHRFSPCANSCFFFYGSRGISLVMQGFCEEAQILGHSVAFLDLRRNHIRGFKHL